MLTEENTGNLLCDGTDGLCAGWTSVADPGKSRMFGLLRDGANRGRTANGDTGRCSG